jgi:3'-phosphoadenosine 5'-phosphosulfate sulfotransferase (PAPS reductase)/FAD synthetase
LPEGGKMELKYAQTCYAGWVYKLYARQISMQFSMGRDKIVLLHCVLLSHVEE